MNTWAPPSFENGLGKYINTQLYNDLKLIFENDWNRDK